MIIYSELRKLNIDSDRMRHDIYTVYFKYALC